MKHNRRREEQQLDTALAGCETGQQHNTTQHHTTHEQHTTAQDSTTQHHTTQGNKRQHKTARHTHQHTHTHTRAHETFPFHCRVTPETQKRDKDTHLGVGANGIEYGSRAGGGGGGLTQTQRA